MDTDKNYPSWLVPIDVARMLKRLGFKERCLFAYDKQQGLTIETSKLHESIIEFDALLFDENDFDYIIAIPTYEQAFDWFRSKGIVSWIEHNGERDEYYIEVTVDRFIRLMKCPKGYIDYNCAKEDLLNLLIKIYCEEKITKTNE